MLPNTRSEVWNLLYSKTFVDFPKFRKSFNRSCLIPSNVALIGGNSTKPASSYYTPIKAVLSLKACGQSNKRYGGLAPKPVQGLATSNRRKVLVSCVFGLFWTYNLGLAVADSLNGSYCRGVFASFFCLAETNTPIVLGNACSPRPPGVHFQNRHRAPYTDGLAARHPCCDATAAYACQFASCRPVHRRTPRGNGERQR